MELHQWCTAGADGSPVQQALASFDRGWNRKGTGKQPTRKDIIDCVEKKIRLTESELVLPLPATVKAQDKRRSLMIWLAAMVALIRRADPRNFPARHDRTDVDLSSRLCNTHPEDMNRAFQLLRFFAKHHMNANPSAGAMDRRQNTTSEPPKFLTDADLRGETAPAPQAPGTLLNIFLEGIGGQVAVLFPTPTDDRTAVTDAERAVAQDMLQDAENLAALVSDDDTIHTGAEVTNVVRTLSDEQRRELYVEFHARMARLNANSNLQPGYDESCTALKLDPHRPTLLVGPALPEGDPLRTLELCKHQPPGALWGLAQLASLGFGVLGDDTGLGKTIILLTMLLLATKPKPPRPIRELSRRALCPTDKWLPTIILGPVSAINTLKLELERFPEFEVYLFLETTAKANVADKARTVHPADWKGLSDILKECDPNDLDTARVVILSTLSTFSKRTVHFEKETTVDENGEPNVVHRARSRLAGKIGLVIVDEAHKIKNPATLAHKSIVLLRALAVISATATILDNKPRDAHGLLVVAWKQMQLRGVEVSGGDHPSLEDYRDTYATLRQDIADGQYPRGNWDLDWARYHRFLNPHAFASLCGTGTLEVPIAADILPLIFALLQVRRFKGQRMMAAGEEEIIGGDFPPYTFVTVELAMTYDQELTYARPHDAAAERLYKHFDVELKSRRRDPAAHRRLCHLTLNMCHENLLQRSALLVKEINGLSEFAGDMGWSRWCRYSTTWPVQTVHRQPFEALQHITAASPKLQWFCGYLANVVCRHKRKVVVFVDWPVNQWTTALLLAFAGIPAFVMRSSTSTGDRHTLARQWNDPEDPTRVFLLSFRVGAVSLNLHKACHDVVFLDVPINANVRLQALGRCNRLGSTHQLDVLMPVVNHTYDQVLQAKTAKKYYGELGGKLSRDFDDDLVVARAIADYGLDGPGAITDTVKTATLERLFREEVTRQYMAMFGERSARHDWDEYRDLYHKDTLETEEGFIHPGVQDPAIRRAVFELARAGKAQRRRGVSYSRDPSEDDARGPASDNDDDREHPLLSVGPSSGPKRKGVQSTRGVARTVKRLRIRPSATFEPDAENHDPSDSESDWCSETDMADDEGLADAASSREDSDDSGDSSRPFLSASRVASEDLANDGKDFLSASRVASEDLAKDEPAGVHEAQAGDGDVEGSESSWSGLAG